MENGYSLCPKTTKELLVTNDSYFIPEPSCNKPTSNIIGLPCWRYTRLNKSLETWVWNVKPKFVVSEFTCDGTFGCFRSPSSMIYHSLHLCIAFILLLVRWASALGSTCTGTSSPVLHFKTFVERKTAPSWWISDLARFERMGPFGNLWNPT